MEIDVIKAMQACNRLVSTLRAVKDDPFHPGAEEALISAAYEANSAMADAGLAERKERPQS